MTELDPEPWVSFEPDTGKGFQCVAERFSKPLAGTKFFPRYGYAQWESDYPDETFRNQCVGCRGLTLEERMTEFLLYDQLVYCREHAPQGMFTR